MILQLSFFFFFNDTATTEIYTLSLHDALPISAAGISMFRSTDRPGSGLAGWKIRTVGGALRWSTIWSNGRYPSQRAALAAPTDSQVQSASVLPYGVPS